MAEKFDLTTHVRNAKGKIISTNLYRLRIVDGNMVFERPPGSGMFYNENNELLSKPAEAKPEKQTKAVKE